MGEDKMIEDEIETVEKASPNLVLEQTEQLKHIFPQIFSESKIDFDKLRTALGDIADDQPERYSFTWAGKRNATQLLQTASYATLTPAVDESINFESTQNLFIEGDNLEVLKLLYKSYSGLVKMIYIDPPYNTGNDFIYPDNFTDPLETYLEITGQKDANGNLLTSNPETGGRYHSNWLSMMYPRLYLARQLLRDDGVIFISIDDHEVHNLRMLMNEVFGEENFIATIIWQKVFSPKNSARHFSEDHDYIIVYARNAEIWTPQALPRTEEANARYSNPDNDPRGDWSSSDLTARNYYSLGQYEVTGPTGKKFTSGRGRYWRQSYQNFLELDRDNRVWWGADGSNVPRLKRFLTEVRQGIVPQTLWTYDKVGHTQEAKQELLEFVNFENSENVLDTVKPTRLLCRMLQIATTSNNQDIVLDFFAGSASTAHAVLKQNREDGGDRRFVCVQLPELLPIPETNLKTIADIGKERIRHVITKFNEADEGKLDLSTREKPEDLGFRLFKLAPSNYKQWQSIDSTDAKAYTEQLTAFTDPLIEGWSPERVVWEVAIKEGYGLNASINHLEEIQENTVWQVTDPDKKQSFLICLDNTLDPSTLSALPLTKDHIFVCLNKALDDTLAANLALQCRLKKI
jgi:adenine-specific DNA-methyltransferase